MTSKREVAPASDAASNARARDQASEVAAEWVPISRLQPHPQNPRKNDGEPVKKVADSIKRFGFSSPIIARLEDGTIIAGHTRWKAAQALGLEKVPVRFLDLDPADARLLMLADNKLGELADWDDELLKSLLSEMNMAEATLAGWTTDELDKMAASLSGIDDDVDTSAAPISFAIEVTCKDDVEQGELLTELEGRGFACKPLIS